MTTRVKWAAKLDHVQEVSILGSADLGFWQQQLAGESLAPVNREGRAIVLIVSAEGRFLGVRFREVSVSVFVASEGQLLLIYRFVFRLMVCLERL